MIFPGALLIFPLTFVCNDIISEVFGFEKSRTIVWVGLVCQALALLTIVLVGILPSAEFWKHQNSYDIILGQSPRIVLGSFVGYYFGELTNSLIISKMKYSHNGRAGKKLAYRFVVSTIGGELFDSILFFTIAFMGIYSIGKICTMIITTWILKTLYEVILLPVSTRLAEKIKKIDQIDIIDTPLSTNYNFIKW